MPARFQLFERIAFSLVVLAALLCSAFIAYESSPEFRFGLHEGKELVLKSTEYSYMCASAMSQPCAQMSVE